VRNTSGGDVEVWAEGAGEKLEALLKWLRRGPPGAIVRGFRYDYTAATGNYADFSIVG
jgi:acylphosphatase